MALSTIELREESAQHTAVVRRRISMAETDRIPGWIGAAFEAIQRTGQQPTGLPFLRTLAMDADGMEIEVGWPVPAPFRDDGDVQAGALPGGLCAVVSYLGPTRESRRRTRPSRPGARTMGTSSQVRPGSRTSPIPRRNRILRSGGRTSTSRSEDERDDRGGRRAVFGLARSDA